MENTAEGLFHFSPRLCQCECLVETGEFLYES
ncbi:MAG TPA: hypothetical protein DCM07_32615 [Planctomycetaceae bacterium]|nr:hypothetical protein [Planctomycetaceae bacterium]HBL45937.1 hypothetical protein [Planctomycetaceae bacterium]